MFKPFQYIVDKCKAVGDALERIANGLNSIADEIDSRTINADSPPLVIEAAPPGAALPAETPHTTNGTAKRRATSGRGAK